GGILWYLVTFGFALVSFITWYFNVYIVTNERIVDVDFLHLLYKELSSTRIARIQDVTYKLGGVFRALFDFGDVFIQTAGTEPNFDFLAVPHPEAVVRKIAELMEAREEKSL
ncbi:PH domain-containing protein, partial [Candidatus Gottesmanbacteria bacterium]|nr:PH domain-containing protein [Candidatus Gottesmanbacteria bacterium]